MSTALAKTQVAASELENVLINGDLARLNPENRVMYYKSVCESVGLNPLTKPFEYITLNGKLTLYARRDATDQLRNIHKISVEILAREVVDDCYVVTARATSPIRQDESLGAVSIAGLKGEARANAMMKAETKAKRRVTLSICGLGLLDETEIDSIPRSRITPASGVEDRITEQRKNEISAIAAKVSGWMQDGSLTDAWMEIDNAALEADDYVYLWTHFDSKVRRQLKEEGERQKVRMQRPEDRISDSQKKRLEARVKELGFTRQAVKEYCKKTYGKEHFTDLSAAEYKALDEYMEAAATVQGQNPAAQAEGTPREHSPSVPEPVAAGPVITRTQTLEGLAKNAGVLLAPYLVKASVKSPEELSDDDYAEMKDALIRRGSKAKEL